MKEIIAQYGHMLIALMIAVVLFATAGTSLLKRAGNEMYDSSDVNGFLQAGELTNNSASSYTTYRENSGVSVTYLEKELVCGQKYLLSDLFEAKDSKGAKVALALISAQTPENHPLEGMGQEGLSYFKPEVAGIYDLTLSCQDANNRECIYQVSLPVQKGVG